MVCVSVRSILPSKIKPLRANIYFAHRILDKRIMAVVAVYVVDHFATDISRILIHFIFVPVERKRYRSR